MSEERLNLADLKAKSPADLLAIAEEWEIENASTMRKGEMMFSLLKEHAEEGFDIGGDGVRVKRKQANASAATDEAPAASDAAGSKGKAADVVDAPVAAGLHRLRADQLQERQASVSRLVISSFT